MRKLKEEEEDFFRGKKGIEDATILNMGVDVFLRFNKDLPGTDMYRGKLDKKSSPLTDEEKDYLRWDLKDLFEPMPLEEAKKEVARLRGGGEDDEESSDDYYSGKKA